MININLNFRRAETAQLDCTIRYTGCLHLRGGKRDVCCVILSLPMSMSGIGYKRPKWKSESIAFIKGYLCFYRSCRNVCAACHYLQSVYYIRDSISELQFYCRITSRARENNVSGGVYVRLRAQREFVRSKSFVKSLVRPDGIIPP